MNPVFRTSPGRTRRRRSHHAIKATHTVLCPQCQSPKRPHASCGNCGFVRPGLQLKVVKSEA